MSTAAPPSNPEAKKPTAGRWVFILSGLGFGVWWAVSFFLHSALLGVVYVAAPDKPAEGNQTEEFGMTISPNRVRDIVEEIRDVEKKEFEQRVEELARIKEELDRLNAEKIQQYNAIMREEAANAPQALATAAEDAVSAQREALDAQHKAEEALARFQDADRNVNAAATEEEKKIAETEASTAASAAKEAGSAAEHAQRKVAAAQNTIGQQLQLLGGAQDAIDAHTVATQAQSLAEKLQQNAEAVLNRVDRDKNALETSSQTLEKERASLDRAKEQLAKAEENLSTAKQSQASSGVAFHEASAKLESNKDAAAKADAAAKEAAEEAKRLASELLAVNEALKKEQANLTKLQQESTQSQNALRKAETTAAAQQKKTDGLAATPGDALNKEQSVLDAANRQKDGAEAALKAKSEALEALRKKVAELQASAENSKTQSAEAARASTEAGGEKNRLANSAKAAAESLKKQEAASTKAAKNLAAAETQLKKTRDALAKQQKKAEDAAVDVAAKKQALDKTVASTSTEQKSSSAAQKASLQLQLAAKSTLLEATANFDPAKAGDELAEDPTVTPIEKPVQGDSLADLYTKARLAENAVAETFKNLRAAELAALRKIPLSEAMALTEVAQSDRPELETESMSRDITDVKGVREQEKTIGAAKDQMDSMVALGKRMKQIATDTGTELSIAQIKTQSARNEQMEKLALEDSGEKAKDLSGAMGGGSGSGLAAGAEPANAHAPGPPGNSGEEGRATRAPGIVGLPVKDYKPLHGRTVRKGMVGVEAGRNPAWLFVDTWNIIGPFPNPGRKNLNTKFPPETVVDLDAVYQGGRKDEKPMPVRWRFFQMPYQVRGKERTPIIKRITPPGMKDYEIFYASTELWFDEAADLWVAIGSDDQSKVWINDQLIWKSGDTHKDWTPNEGLRKVHFRKGINRLLLRLENGQFSGGFSFMVCLAPS